jgi:hypothetical protein
MEEYIRELGKSKASKNEDMQEYLNAKFQPITNSLTEPLEAPMTVGDTNDCILTWYLPDLVSSDAQVTLRSSQLSDY